MQKLEAALGPGRISVAGGNSPPRFVVLADDLSGAAECAAEFGHGPSGTKLLLGQPIPPGHHDDTTVWDLDAREVPVILSTDLLRMASRANTTFFKIDSLMRGRWADLTAQLIRGTGRPAVVCPALPRLGRGVIHGRLALTQQELSRLGFPIGPCPDIVADLKATGLGVGTLVSPSASSPDQFARALRLSLDRNEAVVVDAVGAAELAIVAQELVRYLPRVLVVGSAGIASSLALSLGIKSASPVPLTLPGSMAVVVGSNNVASRSQLLRLADSAGTTVHWWEKENSSQIEVDTDSSVNLYAIGPNASSTNDSKSLVAAFAQHLWPIVSANQILVATGGDTARALCDAAGAIELRVHCQIEPGVCLSSFEAASGSRYTLILKSGSFGDTHTLLRLAHLGPLKRNRSLT